MNGSTCTVHTVHYLNIINDIFELLEVSCSFVNYFVSSKEDLYISDLTTIYLCFLYSIKQIQFHVIVSIIFCFNKCNIVIAWNFIQSQIKPCLKISLQVADVVLIYSLSESTSLACYVFLIGTEGKRSSLGHLQFMSSFYPRMCEPLPSSSFTWILHCIQLPIAMHS